MHWHVLSEITFMWNSSVHRCSFASITVLYKSLFAQINDLSFNEGKIKPK